MKRLAAVLLATWSCSIVGAELDLETLCLDCHRPGQPRGEVPVIEGQQRAYLRHQLQRFKERHRSSFPMSALAAGLDEAAMESVAESLSLRPWRQVPAAVSPDAVRRGRERADVRSCGACHDVGFLGNGDIPRLAGQHPGYLARQIDAFGQDDRYHPPTGTGSPMRVIDSDEAADLAAFLHSLGENPPEGENSRHE